MSGTPKQTGRKNKQQKSSLRTVIFQVTEEKLKKLKAQRDLLSNHYAPALAIPSDPKLSPIEKAEKLMGAITSCPINDFIDDELEGELDNIKVLLEVAKLNPLSSAQAINGWIDKFTKQINFSLQRCDFSYMYGCVMKEYLETEDNVMMTEEDDGLASDEPYVASEEEKNTVKELSDRIFSVKPFDKQKFLDLLTNDIFHFEGYDEKKKFEGFKKDMNQFCETLGSSTISVGVLKTCIKGLYKENLLSADKQRTLKELEANDVALEEVATLLMDKLSNFHTWNWPSPIPIQFKRNIAGKFRAYMEEDVVTAMLLQYMGVRWAMQFKAIFVDFHNDCRMWNKHYAPVDGKRHTSAHSIEARRKAFLDKTFLSTLPSTYEDQAVSGYDEEQNRNTEEQKDKNPVHVKNLLLHMVSNEIHLNKVIRPEKPLTVVQTDMEWFGPSLNHEAILTLMEFFGVTEKWLTFFKRFLQAPLVLRGDDGTEELKFRKNGVAISHLLSTVFGESLLFCMDLYVNKCSSVNMHRMHDDFFFWHYEQGKVIKAWESIEKFAAIAGLKVNMEKSGSIEIVKAKSDAVQFVFGKKPLPQKEIRWGFLVLGSDGIFHIDQENLKPRQEEMSKLLGNSKTVIEWINVYNKYMGFFVRSFGETCLTFGVEHVTECIKSVQYLHSLLFKDTSGCPVKALEAKFPKVFSLPGSEDRILLDAWVYWPVQKGGLGLSDPLLRYTLQKASLENPSGAARKEKKTYHSRFEDLPELDQSNWVKVLDASKERNKRRREAVFDMPEGDGDADSSLPSDSECEEYVDDKGKKKRRPLRLTYDRYCEKGRETRWPHWCARYDALLKSPKDTTPKNYCGDDVNDPWLETLYEEKLQEFFGTRSFINSKLIPSTLINMMKRASMKY